MRINIDDTDTDDGNHYFYNGELFTGELVETDRDGNVLALTSVRKGRPHGPERSWYPDGSRRTESTAVDGRATGICREWHHNGQLAEEREFTERGNLVVVRRWAEDGTPVQ